MKSILPSSVRRAASAAFTLMEIIVVVLIVVMLLALMTPPLVGMIQANRLTQGGQSLLYLVASARQMALTENRPVELRFFHYADENGAEGFHAGQLFFYDEAENSLEPIDGPFYCGSGVMISDSVLSPVLTPSDESGSADIPAAEREPFASLGAHYRKIIFYPNGSTSIEAPLRDAYLTLCATSTKVSDAETPPQNYFTIQIDPVNGSTKSYRPE